MDPHYDNGDSYSQICETAKKRSMDKVIKISNPYHWRDVFIKAVEFCNANHLF
jgi:hypothetical protein